MSSMGRFCRRALICRTTESCHTRVRCWSHRPPSGLPGREPSKLRVEPKTPRYACFWNVHRFLLLALLSWCAGSPSASRLSSTCEAVREHCETFFLGASSDSCTRREAPAALPGRRPAKPPSGVVAGHLVGLSEARHPTLALWIPFQNAPLANQPGAIWTEKGSTRWY